MTHYDSYGNRDVLKIEGRGPHIDLTARNTQRRYLLWVTNDWTGTSWTGQRCTYRTEAAAIRRARKLARRGLGVRVSDREIRPGDSGFLADRSGSYLMDDDGTLHTGPFEQIREMVELKFKNTKGAS
jgi:hypothetical protein